MEKLLAAIIFILFYFSSYSQETLQSVTDRGSTTTKNIGIINTYPWIMLRPINWVGESYIQSGINFAGTAEGNYLGFQNPAGKGFYFRQGTSMILTLSEGV